MSRILLVEPKARTSYPPMGLMKIATYHRLLGDDIVFVPGLDKNARDDFWDKIYITSIFTYNFDVLAKTVQFYRANPANSNVVEVGGISASLLPQKLFKETGVTPHVGLLDKEDHFLAQYAKNNSDLGYLIDCVPSIDNLPPSYDIFGDLHPQYSKILDSAYFLYSTKGCPNSCQFCAVKRLEPLFVDYIPIYPRIKFIADRWGEKENILLLDNNIAASSSYDKIIDELRDCGFEKGARLKKTNHNGNVIYKKRTVDFNQGVDARRMTKRMMKKMAEIAIDPLRLAFDDIAMSKIYEQKARMALDFGINSLSNYMLFNYKDEPVNLYRRFVVNLNILKCYPYGKIFSFPMRYSPVENTDRKYLGDKWTKRELRSVQLVLHATHGIVSHNRDYFLRAFGGDEEQFKRILLYPYHYILNRDIYEYKTKDIAKWESDYAALSAGEKSEFKQLICEGKVETLPVTLNRKIQKILQHYEGEHTDVLPKSENQ
ncbi:MAG: hypothetical protein FWG04_01770 [Desulfovibrionaceae bacterium]|nr:hypothetical protein [Desulfovibrionaceae bacterium]